MKKTPGQAIRDYFNTKYWKNINETNKEHYSLSGKYKHTERIQS